MSDETRSVEDVLAAIRARVKAEEAGLNASPDDGEAPLDLDSSMRVEDDAAPAPLARQGTQDEGVLDLTSDMAVTEEEPLELGSDMRVSDDAPLELGNAFRVAPEEDPLELDESLRVVSDGDDTALPVTDERAPETEGAPLDLSAYLRKSHDRDVPEAPFAMVETPEEPASTVTQLFGAPTERPDEGTETDIAVAEPVHAENYDVWTRSDAVEAEQESNTPVMQGYDVWSGSTETLGEEPAPVDLTSPQDAPSVQQSGVDIDLIRDVIQEELANLALPDDDMAAAPDVADMRGVIRDEVAAQLPAAREPVAALPDDLREIVRGVLIEEMDGELGRKYAKNLRDQLRKDIKRAFKDRGLN